MIDPKQLSGSHDLRLPAWGPYTKKYAGVSHIPDVRSGHRFDLAVLPGFYRRQVLVPNAKWESGYHPWTAAPDLSFYAYRYELEWKDQVYGDVAFAALGDEARLIRCDFVNNTDLDQNLVLHLMAYMNFPPVRPYSDEPIRPSRALLPQNALWLDAIDYDDLGFAVSRPTDNLVYEGWRRAEVRGHDFVGGAAVGMGFGADAGDWIALTARLPRPLTDAVLQVRYRASTGAAAFKMEGTAGGRLHLPACRELSQQPVPLGDLPAGPIVLRLTSLGAGPIELDGFALVPSALADAVRFAPVTWQPVPEIENGPQPSTLILKYPDIPAWYGLAWAGETSEVRQIFSDELDRTLRYFVHEHVQKQLRGSGEGHFTDVFIRPIPVPARAQRTLRALVCSGSSREEVARQLASHALTAGPDESGRALTNAGFLPTISPAGRPYLASQQRLAATLLTNVVYPVYTRRRYIQHYTPGKWWDCLYTWDSGFIALGLLELDVERAIDCLNAYTTPPGDPQAAFIHHGSPAPIQIYAFLELWNRTQDRDLLEYFYPRLRQMHRFLAGRLGSSTTRRMRSGLLKTWDYFYNSAGWDDYPPQVHVHRHGLEPTVTPVINTAHAVRSAKILQMAARALGLPDDVREYQEEIELWAEALNRYAWDSEAGYFSYVMHDAAGRPEGILRHESGANYDMGLDGASPLFAGVCDAAQETALIDRLASPERLWTPIGLSTVDRSAPYFRADGYWNGAVWMPYQWIFWKSLLDLGRGDLAQRIGETALELWKSEVDATYNCFEHFIVQSGRGAGWHHFGGLSAPVLSWFGAYHRPGRLTCGFDAWVTRQQFGDGQRALAVELSGGPRQVIAAMAAGGPYRAQWNGVQVNSRELYPGVLEITLPSGAGAGELRVAM